MTYDLTRRKFIKAGCGICLAAMAGDLLSVMPAYAAAKAKVFKVALNDKNEAELPLSLFEETTLQFIRVKGSFYDIALHKEEDGTYTAMLMKCTHMDNQLVLTGEGFRCSLHGSEYDKKGTVTKGPAEAPLLIYPTALTETSVLITIPNNNEE